MTLVSTELFISRRVNLCPQRMLHKTEIEKRRNGLMIKVESQDSITTIALQHGKMNTLDLDLLSELSKQFRSFHSSDQGAVVLTGIGPAFSAGVDLRKILDEGSAYIEALLPALSATVLDIFQCPLPVVAAINGHALAGGCLLAAAADVRLMGVGKIGLPEFGVGVPLPVAGVEVLRSATGSHASKLICNATVTTAQEAQKVGLVSRVTPDDLLAQAREDARRLAAVPPRTFALTKTQLHAPFMASIEANTGQNRAVLNEWLRALRSGRIEKYLASLSR